MSFLNQDSLFSYRDIWRTCTDDPDGPFTGKFNVYSELVVILLHQASAQILTEEGMDSGNENLGVRPNESDGWVFTCTPVWNRIFFKGFSVSRENRLIQQYSWKLSDSDIIPGPYGSRTGKYWRSQ